MPKEEAAFIPIPIVIRVSEETVAKTYTQIKDEIAELFKNELEALDKDNETETLDADSTVNVRNPCERPLSKKQRRQIIKRNRQRDRENMRKIKHTGDNKASAHNSKTISPVKNDDMEKPCQCKARSFHCRAPKLTAVGYLHRYSAQG